MNIKAREYWIIYDILYTFFIYLIHIFVLIDKNYLYIIS